MWRKRRSKASGKAAGTKRTKSADDETNAVGTANAQGCGELARYEPRRRTLAKASFTPLAAQMVEASTDDYARIGGGLDFVQCPQ